jgi:hypothetical protein
MTEGRIPVLPSTPRLVVSVVQAIASPRGGFTWLIGLLRHETIVSMQGLTLPFHLNSWFLSGGDVRGRGVELDLKATKQGNQSLRAPWLIPVTKFCAPSATFRDLVSPWVDHDDLLVDYFNLPSGRGQVADRSPVGYFDLRTPANSPPRKSMY